MQEPQRKDPTRRVGLWVLLGGLLLMTAACGGTARRPLAEISGDHSAGYSGTLLSPSVPRPDVALVNIGGGLFHLNQRPRGEITALFFGYTHCPDVCPTTMADLAVAKRMVPRPVADRLVVVFVTEDPRRDTPTVLRTWLNKFDPSFVGLIGGGSTTSYVLSQLHLPQTVLESPSPGGYGVSHSGIVYVFSDGGTLIYTGGTTPRQYASDLTRLAG